MIRLTDSQSGREKESKQKKLTARNGGIAHLNFYDVKIDSENRITRMTGVYSS